MQKFIAGLRDVRVALGVALRTAASSQDTNTDSAVDDRTGTADPTPTAYALNHGDAHFFGADGTLNDVGATRQPCLSIGLSPLQRARWQCAVSAELALPGRMVLQALNDGEGQIRDFRWITANAMASHLLGCAGMDLVGLALRATIAAQGSEPDLFGVYRAALIARRDGVCETPRAVEQARGALIHDIQIADQRLTVMLWDPYAMRRARSCAAALRTLQTRCQVKASACL